MSVRSLTLGLAALGVGLALAATAFGAAPEPGALTEAVRTMLQDLERDASEPFTVPAGHRTWYRREPNGRSCTSCHGETLDVPGRHEKTGKRIEPMARSVNPERLTERREMDKWFLRNCKWTYGRECTAQEKGDILVWLSGQ
ncbi:MAG: DUF1924 domain-containing protein [Pseudomonadales bacterium]